MTPFDVFNKWYEEAKSVVKTDPNAMVVTSVDKNTLAPSSRVVLLKLHDKESFTFFTNYNSQKGREILDNPQVSLLFYWRELNRQIRIQGQTRKSSDTTSDDYWESRPLESRIHAAFSQQSDQINNLDEAKKELEEFSREHLELGSIPRPAHWGGIQIIPKNFEFWEAGEFRWHLRRKFNSSGSTWEETFLYP